jgi:hypothetical protein
VHRFADDDYNSSRTLYEYYVETLRTYMQEAYNNIKIDDGEALVDSFLKENTKCKILTHWMKKVFTYLVYFN